MGVNQFLLQEQVSILMSAANIYYDANNDSIPLQAYEITDASGEPLGPFLMTTPLSQANQYVLDVTSLSTGSGVKPYHLGQELVAASDRAWRMDYYKPDAQTGVLWTTVMSGSMTAEPDGTYELNVDLGLRWTEEGDNLNRLGNGQFSHIALAVGDFRSFSMRVLTPGSVLLSADVLTASPTLAPTTPPTTSNPTVTPTPAPSSAPTAETPAPTQFITPPGQPGDSTTAGVAVDSTPAVATTTSAEPDDKIIIQSGGNGKKGSKSSKGADYRIPGDDCDGSKGNGKKSKKCKKSKKAKQSAGATGAPSKSGSTGIAVGCSAAVFLIAGWAMMAYRRDAVTNGYEEVKADTQSTQPQIPTAFAAFGTFSTAELRVAAEHMRVPPTEDEKGRSP